MSVYWGGVSCAVSVNCDGVGCHVLCLYTMMGWGVMRCLYTVMGWGVVYSDGVGCHVPCLYTVMGWGVMHCVYTVTGWGVMSCVCIL